MSQTEIPGKKIGGKRRGSKQELEAGAVETAEEDFERHSGLVRCRVIRCRVWMLASSILVSYGCDPFLENKTGTL